MKDLEVIVENLLSEVFATVTQATEGLDILQNLYQYSKRKDLFTEFEKRTVKVPMICVTALPNTQFRIHKYLVYSVYLVVSV